MKIPFRPRLAALFLLVCTSAVLASCTGAVTNTANTNQQTTPERTTGTRGGSLTYRLTTPPTSLNPVMMRAESDFFLAFYLTSGRLVDFDHDKRAYAPGLVEVWKLADDGRTLDLTLREGLKFSDGEPLTTADVEFTIRALYAQKESLLGNSLLIGERPFETRVVDARRFQIVFPEQVAAPETYLVNIPVLSHRKLEEELKQGRFGQAYGVTADPQQIVTAGPFVFESIAPGERVVLRRNPHYWKKDSAGTQLPYLDTLVVEIIASQDATFTRLKEGGLDFVDRTRASDYAALRAEAGSVRAVDLGPGLTTDHIFFNLNSPERTKLPEEKRAWFSDVRFRRAVSHAIDRESIAAGTLQGLATPLYNFIPPSNRDWVAADAPRTEHDLERARALLAEAGFAMRGTAEAPELYDAGGRRVEFTLIVPQESAARVQMATALQQDLGRLGINMQVAAVEVGELNRRMLQSFDYDAALFGVTVTDFDPSSYSTLLASSSPQHQWHPAQTSPATDWETRLDALIAQLARERDVARRKSVFRDIQLLMAEQLPIIPLAARHVTCAASARVGNYRPSPVVPFSLWNAEELFVKK